MIPRQAINELLSRQWKTKSYSGGYMITKAIGGSNIIIFLDKTDERNMYTIRHDGPVRRYRSVAAHFVPGQDMYRPVCTGSILGEFFKVVACIRNYVVAPTTMANPFYGSATNTGRINRLNYMRSRTW